SGRQVTMRVHEPVAPEHARPIVIAPGWGTDSDTLRYAADSLATRRTVVTFNHHRNVDRDPLGRKTNTLGAVVCAVADLFGRRPEVWAYSEGLSHAVRLAA